ncbi:MAG: NUDIX hydrolase [Clostridiaceae bacterium]|jgi:8-oxo-dGTP pyrophosphatase MutT (NUDIX family)|nr:NUDIX hydrolase [Clostridiaceae bacterium]
MDGYIKYIRKAVGHRRIILNFAGGVIVDEKGGILLQRRSDRNKWGFLGGAIELGESAAEAAIREIKEESGLVVKVDCLIGIYTKYFDKYPNGDEAQTVTHAFMCSVTGGTLAAKDSETLELKFFSPSAPPDLVNVQHMDLWDDVCNGRKNVFR